MKEISNEIHESATKALGKIEERKAQVLKEYETAMKGVEEDAERQKRMVSTLLCLEMVFCTTVPMQRHIKDERVKLGHIFILGQITQNRKCPPNVKHLYCVTLPK